MASCNGNCETFSASNAQWFKIDAEGYDPTTKQWAAAKLIANGFTWTSTIPAELAPGQYCRTPLGDTAVLPELHVSILLPKSSFPVSSPYRQINLTGSGKGQPSASSLVSIPALYDGVVWPDIYTNFGTFTIPGPPPVTFDTTGGGKPAPATTAVTPARPTTTAGAISSTSTTTPVAGTPVASGHCQLNSRRLLRRRLK
ncbi:hypothetical protein H0H81_009171 [Sphagnurus paluster]|uniref:lytic cellulose monooxygenase (C4-dehydrogenating) n=1 Tax=Sphagnurus paluster TaxID=117069 RepID=A0A9P7FYW9_9AGAR|nr:hypothetical protein H0H81_009171 [Sphagnurus paluster]